MTNPANPFDGETTPPTNYDGATTPPTVYATSNQVGRTGSKDPNRSKLIGILAALVVLLLIAIGVLLFMANNDEPTATEGGVTTQEAESTTAQDDAVDVHEDDVNYADLDEDHGQFDQNAEHLKYRKIDPEGAMSVRRAFIQRIGELARAPSTPEVMPSRIDGVDAGPLGEFSCLAHQGPPPHHDQFWSWDCRGPEGRQVVSSAVLMADVPPTPGVAESPGLLSNGTPSDPLWKQRAINETAGAN